MEPLPRASLPRMPADMDERAQAVWKHVMKEMGLSRVITGADADVLRIYCEAKSRYLGAQMAYTTPLVNMRGYLVKNPLHQVIRDNADQIRLLARELGLSPAARANLQVMDGSSTPDIDDELGPPPRLRVVRRGA